MEYTTIQHPELEEPSKPLFLTRDFGGYLQILETFETQNGERHTWCFSIYGFSPCDMKASLEKSDGTFEYVPIDAAGNILVNGKRYSSRYWSH